MRIHICIYKDNHEVININDVTDIEFFTKGNFIAVTTDIRQFIIHKNQFDRIEVDTIND